jgi:phosphoglycolate phosphatase
MDLVKTLIEEHKKHVADRGIRPIQMVAHRFDRDFRCFLRRIPVDAGADSWKTDAANLALFRELETGAIATGELLRLPVLTVAINRTDCMKYVLGRKGTGRGRDRAAGGTTTGPRADLIQIAHDRRAAHAMNGAVHASAPVQTGIGGIDDGIDADLRDVANHQAELLAVGEIQVHSLWWHVWVERYSKELEPSNALVLFDIDGTLIRRAGAHHRQALVDAVRRTVGIETTTENVPVAGMLDGDILHTMMTRAGMKPAAIRRAMPEVMEHAQKIYIRTSPVLERKVCPGVRRVLGRLQRRGAVMGLVTGNLTRIGWRKMERAGLRSYFRYGAFAELAKDRAGLVRIAIRQARREKWIKRDSSISLIGDHPNDVRAARANGIQAIAVATGLVSIDELRSHSPDVLLPDLRSLTLEMLF